jgi:hypothetical protein
LPIIPDYTIISTVELVTIFLSETKNLGIDAVFRDQAQWLSRSGVWLAGQMLLAGG